jgi:tRNA dimethylallyltransferase
MNQPLAIFLMGPTAAGKTGLAVELIRQLPLEIISVDSALIYRGMDIGTAKPDAQTLAQAPHRLIDIRDPSEIYSAAEFRHDALQAMDDIIARGNTPLLVGGTTLYFRALEEGLSDLPSADAEVRAELEAEAAAVGWPAMHTRLQQVDPEAAARIHPNDPQRIQRALEVYELCGEPMSALFAEGRQQAPAYRFLKIALVPGDRALLHARIEERFQVMLDQGFLDEVRQLRVRGDLHADLPSMRAVGYRQAWNYLDGNLSAEEWVERGVIATRQYAKRQMTWLRSERDCHWIDPLQEDSVVAALDLIKRAGAAAR